MSRRRYGLPRGPNGVILRHRKNNAFSGLTGLRRSGTHISGPAVVFCRPSPLAKEPMRPMSRFKPGMTVRGILAERLEETKRSSDDLANAVEVPGRYIQDIIHGRRRPPMPARTDVYDRMTRFLKLGRTELVDCATAERAASAEDRSPPDAAVRDQMLDLCTARTATRLRRESAENQASLVALL